MENETAPPELFPNLIKLTGRGGKRHQPSAPYSKYQSHSGEI